MSREKFKAFAVGLFELGLVVTAVFSVATAFDHLHRYLELFSHFRLQYFVASVLLTIPFVVMRWRGYIVIGLATIALNAWLVVPWYLPQASAADSGATAAETFKLMLANVLASNHDPDRFIELVRAEQPELIVMQEATPAWLASLSAIDSAYPYRLAEPRDDPFGIALYSRFPLDSTTIIESPPNGFPDLIAVARIGGARLTLISTHPIPPLGVANYGARNLQLDGVARLAARTPGAVVVVGDLNTTIWAHHYRRFEEISGLRSARRGFGVVPTWPLFLLPAMIPIDHCLVSEHVTVTDFRSGPRIGSDHLPIFVSLTLDNEARNQ